MCGRAARYYPTSDVTHANCAPTISTTIPASRPSLAAGISCRIACKGCRPCDSKLHRLVQPTYCRTALFQNDVSGLQLADRSTTRLRSKGNRMVPQREKL